MGGVEDIQACGLWSTALEQSGYINPTNPLSFFLTTHNSFSFSPEILEVALDVRTLAFLLPNTRYT
jgi:hypothetical protein